MHTVYSVPVEVDEVGHTVECPVPGPHDTLRVHQQQVLPVQGGGGITIMSRAVDPDPH